MNVAGIGAFTGGLAGGYLEQQAADARNKLYGAQAGLYSEQAKAVPTREAREQQTFTNMQNWLHQVADLAEANGHPSFAGALRIGLPPRPQGQGPLTGEPPRDSRRLHYLRGWSHEQIDEVFAGGPRAGRSADV
jgi:hypothetical protein